MKNKVRNSLQQAFVYVVLIVIIISSAYVASYVFQTVLAANGLEVIHVP